MMGRNQAKNGQLPPTDAELLRIAASVIDLGCRASVEYPGFVEITMSCGRIGMLGTVNGPWACDVYQDRRAAEELRHELPSITVPETHHATAEGIARFVVGRLTGIVAYTAYASAAEERRADQDERRARGGKRG